MRFFAINQSTSLFQAEAHRTNKENANTWNRTEQTQTHRRGLGLGFTRLFWIFSVAESIDVSDVIDPKATEFGGITQNEGHYAVQGHSR